MTDRRRFPRYVFLTPVGGRARTVLDCLVEARDGADAVVVTTRAAARGEDFVMQCDSPGEPSSSAVRVVSSTPDIGNGATRFKLQLRVQS